MHIMQTMHFMQNMQNYKIMQTMHFMHPSAGVREKHAEIAGEGWKTGGRSGIMKLEKDGNR